MGKSQTPTAKKHDAACPLTQPNELLAPRNAKYIF